MILVRITVYVQVMALGLSQFPNLQAITFEDLQRVLYFHDARTPEPNVIGNLEFLNRLIKNWKINRSLKVRG